MEAIYKRRSVRKFTEKKISEEDLKLILKSGMNSPSAENDQEWEFVVITDDEIKQEIYKNNKHAFAVTTAPILILACANMDYVTHKEENFWIQDLAASSQNMLIQAMDLGISSTWHGLYKEHEEMITKLVSLPDNVKALTLIAFGYAAKEREANNRYLEDRIHYNKY